MAIVQNFSPTDFITKTKTISVTAGQTYTLGSSFNGGTAVDVFTDANFTVKQAGMDKIKDVDFALTGVDKRLSADYGYTFYTLLKSINITGSIDVSYRCHASFADADIINAHEDRLNSHDSILSEHSSHLVAIDNTDVAQNNRLSAAEAAIVEETENRTAADTWLQSVIDLETEYRTEADTALQTNITNEATARADGDTAVQTNLNNHTSATSVHGATSAPTASTIIARDADGRAQVANPSAYNDIANKSYVDGKIASAGGGDVISDSTSATDGNFAVMSGTTGKTIAASGYSPSSFMASNAACGRLSWNGSRISIDGSENNAAVSYADNAGSVTSLSGHNISELSNNSRYVTESGISALYAYDMLGLGQTSRQWCGMAAAPNGDIYACANGGDIYKQSGGVGNFVALGQTSRNWFSMAAAPNGDIYACAFGGDIYKQSGGTGDFVALGQTTRDWRDMTAAPNGDIYACAFGGDIYKQTGGVGAFVALPQTSRNWQSMAAAPNGDIYAGVNNGDIYKQTGGVGAFVALSQTTRSWFGMAAAPNGDVYAGVPGGDIYKAQYRAKIGGVGSLYIGIDTTPPRVLLFDGSTKARASYPELWAMIVAKRLPYVTDTAWLAGAVGAFSTGDGSTTFRLPDWRGLFLRGMGTNSILAMANLTKFTGGALAAVMLDAMQVHWHNIMGDNNNLMLAVDSGSGQDSGSYYNFSDVMRAPAVSFKAKELMPDGTNGDPRKAGETRPVSVSLNFGIYFE